MFKTALLAAGGHMLVLMRRIDESIRIGRDVRLTVTCIRGRQVTLGIEAPPNVEIWREELDKTALSSRRKRFTQRN